MKKGTTLIEVLVAALILSIGGASLLMGFVTCQRIIMENTNRYNSSLIINGHFEEITRRENITDVKIYLDSVQGQTVKKEISPGLMKEYTVRFKETSVVNPEDLVNLSWIEATVTWESDKGKQYYTMSVFTNQPG